MKNEMTFGQFNKACDYVAEKIGNEDLALDIVSDVCKIFNLEPTETEDEFMEKAISILMGFAE